MARVDVERGDRRIWVDRVSDFRDNVVHVHVRPVRVPAVCAWRAVHILRELLPDCSGRELGDVDVLVLLEGVVVEREPGGDMPLDDINVVRAGLVVVRMVAHDKSGDRGESGKLQKTLLCRL